jgi:hypothetical protein
VPGAAEVQGLAVAAKSQVALSNLLLPSRRMPVVLVCAGLQFTANATTGKKRMPRVFGFIIGLVTCWRLGLDAGKH